MSSEGLQKVEKLQVISANLKNIENVVSSVKAKVDEAGGSGQDCLEVFNECQVNGLNIRDEFWRVAYRRFLAEQLADKEWTNFACGLSCDCQSMPVNLSMMDEESRTSAQFDGLMGGIKDVSQDKHADCDTDNCRHLTSAILRIDASDKTFTQEATKVDVQARFSQFLFVLGVVRMRIYASTSPRQSLHTACWQPLFLITDSRCVLFRPAGQMEVENEV